MQHEFHTPVLMDDVLKYLPDFNEGVFVDGTAGGGGHAEKILSRLGPACRLVCFDMDDEALTYARARLQEYGDRVLFINDNFKNLHKRLHEIGVSSMNGLLLDLGVSSHQIDNADRGFSFQSTERIDMRMNRRQTLDGWTVINSYPPEQMFEIIREYGEERFASRIVRNIIKARSQNAMTTGIDLVAAVRSAVGGKILQKSLARVFQAIRIEVNNELVNLQQVLDQSMELLVQGGRIMVISYHSLEDRIVKHWIKKGAEKFIRSGNKLAPDVPVQPRLLELTRKPIIPGELEVQLNPRARSAKLRIAERI
ncbi:MAG: 16S rRNA (cytosine(1402)-N(4))-methyltransferase RsmH [Bacteroidota bacterium]